MVFKNQKTSSYLHPDNSQPNSPSNFISPFDFVTAQGTKHLFICYIRNQRFWTRRARQIQKVKNYQKLFILLEKEVVDNSKIAEAIKSCGFKFDPINVWSKESDIKNSLRKLYNQISTKAFKLKHYDLCIEYCNKILGLSNESIFKTKNFDNLCKLKQFNDVKRMQKDTILLSPFPHKRKNIN